MKNLEEVKYEVARQSGFRDFNHVIEHDRKGLFDPEVLQRINDSVALQYAEQFIVKAVSYDELDDKIAKCYGEGDDDFSDDTDLGTIGEIAASHFGYL